MFREMFVRSPLLALPLFAMAIFFAVFAAAVIRTWRKRPAQFGHLERLPLLNDEVSRHE